jgi:hypothetical protein
MIRLTPTTGSRAPCAGYGPMDALVELRLDVRCGSSAVNLVLEIADNLFRNRRLRADVLASEGVSSGILCTSVQVRGWAISRP